MFLYISPSVFQNFRVFVHIPKYFSKLQGMFLYISPSVFQNFGVCFCTYPQVFFKTSGFLYISPNVFQNFKVCFCTYPQVFFKTSGYVFVHIPKYFSYLKSFPGIKRSFYLVNTRHETNTSVSTSERLKHSFILLLRFIHCLHCHFL